MATKETVTARLYLLDFADTRHQLTADSSADLAQQVKDITGSKQAAQLARAAWGDDEAELKASGVHIRAVGAIVRKVWLTVPPLKGQESAEEKAAQAQQPSEQAPKEAQPAASSAEQPQAPKTAPVVPASQPLLTPPTANPQQPQQALTGQQPQAQSAPAPTPASSPASATPPKPNTSY